MVKRNKEVEERGLARKNKFLNVRHIEIYEMPDKMIGRAF